MGFRFDTASIFTMLVGMSVKEIALHTISELPDDADWTQIQGRIDFMAGVEKGLAQLDDGQGIPLAEIEAELAQWAKA